MIQREIATAKGVPRDQPLTVAIGPSKLWPSHGECGANCREKTGSAMVIQSMLSGNNSSGSSSGNSSGRSSFRSNANSNASTSGYGSMSSTALVDMSIDMDMSENRDSNGEIRREPK